MPLEPYKTQVGPESLHLSCQVCPSTSMIDKGVVDISIAEVPWHKRHFEKDPQIPTAVRTNQRGNSPRVLLFQVLHGATTLGVSVSSRALRNDIDLEDVAVHEESLNCKRRAQAHRPVGPARGPLRAHYRPTTGPLRAHYGPTTQSLQKSLIKEIP